MRKWKVYAPVIIPTLCRFDHFYRCLESLERCMGAEYTEVYVGLDYPPSDKYKEGWKRIDAYLSKKEKNNKFGKLIVQRRDHNCGVNGKGNNIGLLVEEIRTKYDSYIYSEDDNEFAPNFLEYMNAGLERYKNNPNVLRICGNLMPWNEDYEGCMKTYPYNAFPAMDFNALGTGIWFDKSFPLPFTKDSILKSWMLTLKAIHHGYCLAVARCMQQLNKESQLPDVCLRLYCAFNQKYCIFPTISKVKNWGYDGTGLNSDDDPKWIEIQKLDTSVTFELDDFEIKEYREVKRFIGQMFDAPPGYSKMKMRWWVLKVYIFYRITGVRVQDIPQGERAGKYFFKKLFRKRGL
ncbi:MAG: hypothetical protein IKN86_08340 [Bacteroidaceae bacterium]|nr:hypothetical protein [Bacteroidaceae bacterium]